MTESSNTRIELVRRVMPNFIWDGPGMPPLVPPSAEVFKLRKEYEEKNKVANTAT